MLFRRAKRGRIPVESRGNARLVKRAKPDTFEDIIALGLFPAGPLGSGMDRDWVDRNTARRRELSAPGCKRCSNRLRRDRVSGAGDEIAQSGGYSLGGADLLRRAMGKKKPEEMAKERAKFETGAAEREVDPRKATQIFDLMEKFAEYGFNKSHSAAYALVAYQTAWLKVHYPAEFLAAVLSSDMDNTDKVVMFLDEARAVGLTVLPPDANASNYLFEAIDAQTVRYAWAGQGRRHAPARRRAGRTQGGVFTALIDFEKCRQQQLNRRTLDRLDPFRRARCNRQDRASPAAAVTEV